MKKIMVLLCLLIFVGCKGQDTPPATEVVSVTAPRRVLEDVFASFFDADFHAVNANLTEASKRTEEDIRTFEDTLATYTDTPEDLLKQALPDIKTIVEEKKTDTTANYRVTFSMVDKTKIEGMVQKIIVGKVFDLDFHRLSREEQEAEVLKEVIGRLDELGVVEEETTFVMRFEDDAWKLDANAPGTFDFVQGVFPK